MPRSVLGSYGPRLRARCAPATRSAARLLALLAWAAPCHAEAGPSLAPEATAWTESGVGGIRGVTIGPIENARHGDVGYGTLAGWRALETARALGANWVSITPFGRVWDLRGGGVDLSFEAPVERNRENVLAAIEQAHALGLKVLLVPHLWVETGGWRAHIDPGDETGWQHWERSYARFLLFWAEVAAQGGAEMFSVGVELRSWLTTHHASSFRPIVRAVRERYHGLITYSGNWDDVAHTLVLDELDVIGVNAFYPLTTKPDATFAELHAGAVRIGAELRSLAQGWQRPVLLTEMGYTTRRDPALRPWEWPDGMKDVVVDECAQALATRALLAPLLDEPTFAGFFVWRIYADPRDVSQEAEWGFSPLGKRAELELRDAFAAHWAADGPDLVGRWLTAEAARSPGVWAWEPELSAGRLAGVSRAATAECE